MGRLRGAVVSYPIKLQLVVNVEIVAADTVPKDTLKQNLLEVGYRAYREGQLTGELDAEVNDYLITVVEKDTP
jgi:putative AlgH/UPF0301 family transcriptional regulator